MSPNIHPGLLTWIRVIAVRGGWGNWLPWTPCSATCGNGVQKRYRRCDKPLPKLGGSCIGLGEETRDCQKTNCPGNVYKL